MDLSYEAISMRVHNMLDINTSEELISRVTYGYLCGYLKALLEAGVLNEYQYSKLKETVNKHKYTNQHLREEK